ncbi:MAG: Asp23/Gls24 family envelope stress response protein [Ardenticatenaceae bacterium]|nr:Asp23/Gls24 family envelope stress response protein [Ardenticatenaceae bacterium]
MSESDLQTDSIGRIEVAPEVIATIAYFATIAVDGVAQTVSPSSGRFRRGTVKHEGVILTYEGNRLLLDIYIWIEPGKNMMNTSRAVQQAVYEAIDQMVGMEVQTVNVHVENVSPVRGSTAAVE